MADEKGHEITHGPLKGTRIELASQDETEGYQYELEEILDVIGHPEALITDLSSIGDFISDENQFDECAAKMAEAFGISVTDPAERLVDLAKRVRTARKR